MSSTDTKANNQYTVRDFVEDIQGLYSSEDRLYSGQINDDEFNTLDAMNQLRSEYRDTEQSPGKVDRITSESDWDKLKGLLDEAVEEGLLDRETKQVDLPSESYPRKNLFYSFKAFN